MLNTEERVSYLEFLQDFVSFPMIFTKVFHFFAFWTASIVLHFCTLWVDFRAFWLIANRSILSTDTGAVGMTRKKTFSQFVYKATVIHTALPSVVIKDQIVITGGLVPLIGRVVFMVDGSWSDQSRDDKQKYPGFMDMKSHPPPQLLHGISMPDRNSCFHRETSAVVWKQIIFKWEQTQNSREYWLIRPECQPAPKKKSVLSNCTVTVSFELRLFSIIVKENKAYEVQKTDTCACKHKPMKRLCRSGGSQNHLIFTFLIYAVEFSDAP